MSDSILDNTKKVLGIDASYTVFDVDIMMHINSAFNTLTQLGLGPPVGFMILDDTAVWADFFDPVHGLMQSVKTYIYLRVRLLFDPPGTSFVIASMERQILELEWRLNVQREEATWVPPTTSLPITE